MNKTEEILKYGNDASSDALFCGITTLAASTQKDAYRIYLVKVLVVCVKHILGKQLYSCARL